MKGNASSLKKELVAQERELLRAIRTSDVTRLEELLADEYVFTSATGIVWGKKQAMDDFRNPRLVIRSIRAVTMRVLPLRAGGVVVGKAQVEGHVGPRSASGVYRFTRVWAKKASGWQMIATHVSLVERRKQT